MGVLLLSFKNAFIFAPFSPLNYAYIIPFGLVLYSSLERFASYRLLHDSGQEKDAAFRSLIFATAAFFLSPFLQWWFCFPENRYFFVSLQFFLLSNALFFFNLAGELRLGLEKISCKTGCRMAMGARYIILFCSMAPILAFVTAFFLGKSDPYGIYLIVMELPHRWGMAAALIPILFLCCIAWFAARKIEEKSKAPEALSIF